MQELSVLASRALGIQKQFTAVADNVANASTHGYKRLDVSFREMVSKPKGHATASYVADKGVTVDYSQGGFENTNSPLDMALGSEGFFAVQTAQGVQYTRKGQFMLNSEAQLTTSSGNPVLDSANAPIQFPQDVKQILVGRDGTISTEEGILAQLGVFAFNQEGLSRLQRAGDATFAAPSGVTPQVVDAPTVKQGMLETSNVNAVQEMVTMQQVSQAYQNSLKLLKGVEDLESGTIRTLGGTQ